MRVVIVQRRLAHYRVGLFDDMRIRLRDAGVDLDLVHGEPAPDEIERRDAGSLPWATQVTNRYIRIGRRYLCWQPIHSLLEHAHLVVIAQENSLLSNYPLILRPTSRLPRVAFWGHGANLQSRSSRGPSERLKRWASTRVHWWFAYTQLSADVVVRAGFDRERVTVLNNAIDTSELSALRTELGSSELGAVRTELGLGSGPVGLFLGSLHRDKRLDFLLEAARRVRGAVADFKLLVIGDGPDRQRVARWCAENDWVRWLGARQGPEKVRYAAVCELMLNPGLVGLNVLDALALGIPMVTTVWPHHSPEIAYLRSGRNGTVTPDDVGVYADTVIRLLRDDAALARLRTNCFADAREYTLDAMARRFTHGILSALAAPSGPQAARHSLERVTVEH